MYTRPPNGPKRAPGARDDGSSIQDERSGATEDVTPEQVRRTPKVRVDQARIAARAPRRELSPAQALDLVRRAERRDRDDPLETP